MKLDFKYLLIFSILFTTFSLKGQNVTLAMNYVEQGEYEKAKVIYKKLHKKNPNSQNYLLGLVDVFIQLEEFTMAENLLKDYLKKPGVYPNIIVELGHIHEIQKDTVKANSLYKEALEIVKKRPDFAYSTGMAFEKYNLLDYAIENLEIAIAERQSINYSVKLAKLYGEKGNKEKMYDNYLALAEQNDKYFEFIQRNLSEYIKTDAQHENNLILKRLLLKKLQQSPKLLYNQILSWVFIQEEDYVKSFAQERAIFKRSQYKNFNRIFELADVVEEAKQYEFAIEIYDFIENESQNKSTQLEAIEAQLKARLNNNEKPSTLKAKFENYLEEYGYNAQSIWIQTLYAEFLAFKEENYKQALALLDQSSNYELNNFQVASIQMLIADIYVAQEQFNNALVKYSLVSKQVKNTPLAQLARYKIAMTSYYKGDFDWALTQLDVLKKASSYTIANDAMEKALFIKQGKSEVDSTQLALKQMAKADLMIYQSKPKKALEELDSLIDNANNYHILDHALYKKAQVLEQIGQYEKASVYLEQVISDFPNSIIVDNALFSLANIQINKLKKPQKALENLENLIFNHQDSIFFVEGRKLYRKLRNENNLE